MVEIKFKHINSSLNILERRVREIETDSSSDTENQEHLGIPKISSYFPAIGKHSTMAEQQLYTADTSPLLRLKDDMLQSMKDLNDSLTQCILSMSNDLSKKFEDLKVSNSFLEASFKEAKLEVSEAKQQVQQHEFKITDQHVIIEKQEKEIAILVAYSKFYNLKFYNIPENPNENTNILLDKLEYTLHMMEIDRSRLYIDTIHRLPSNARGLRPVIVKFVSKFKENSPLICTSNMLLQHTIYVLIEIQISKQTS